MKKSVLLISIMLVFVSTGLAQTPAFTYQGKLIDAGAPPTTQYDFTFKLFATASGGSQIGADVTVDDVQVTAGIFTVNLNFGAPPFTSTTGNYLEIAVRTGASTGAYTTLTPRQPLTSSPYSVQTIRAASAAVADNALQLGGVTANQFVQTNDSRLSDARTPLAGSTNYIQNIPGIGQQSGSFNINGGGTANIFNAATQYNIGGSRVLSQAGNGNFFAGVGAGQSNTTGVFNAFFGAGAGFANLGGSENAFFGYTAGRLNSSGEINSFFGKSSGFSNTEGRANTFFGYNAGFLNSLGNNNTFVGVIAGDTNTTGTNNTVIGFSADVATNNLSYATAIGADAVVSSSNTIVLGRNQDRVRIPGSLVMTSPNGACWFITVNNSGALSTISVACP